MDAGVVEDYIVEEVVAYFVNRTMVGCPLPVYETPQTIQIDITFDDGTFYTYEPIVMYIIPEPNPKTPQLNHDFVC